MMRLSNVKVSSPRSPPRTPAGAFAAIRRSDQTAQPTRPPTPKTKGIRISPTLSPRLAIEVSASAVQEVRGAAGGRRGASGVLC